MNSSSKVWEGIGKIGIGFLVFPISYILKGWVLSKLWVWFIIPMFDLPDFSIAYFLGLSIIVGYLTKTADFSRKTPEEEQNSFWLIIFLNLLYPLFTLFIGWAITLFI